MKAQILLAVAFAATVSGRVIEARQAGRPTSKPAATGDLGSCGLDSFEGHPAEANRYCSSLLKSGTATRTATYTATGVTTVQTTVYITLYPPTTTSTPKPPTTTTKSTTTTPKPPTTTTTPTTTTPKPPTTITTTTSSSPSPTAACGIVGYTKDTAAYNFDSSGTKNTFALCSAACKADPVCKSFGYGEANCMLFNVDAASNTNYNPMSPYTFYDVSCPNELPVRKADKRQLTFSLTISEPSKLSSACSCYIGTGPAGVTKTTSVTVTSQATTTNTVTKTLSLLPGDKLQ